MNNNLEKSVEKVSKAEISRMVQLEQLEKDIKKINRSSEVQLATEIIKKHKK